MLAVLHAENLEILEDVFRKLAPYRVFILSPS